MNKKVGYMKGSLQGVKILFHINSGKMIGYIFLDILHAISYILQLAFMQYFFDAINTYEESTLQIQNVVYSLLLMGVGYITAQVMNGVFNCYGQILNLGYSKGIKNRVFERVEQMKVLDFEDHERLNCINKAIQGSQMLFWVSTSILDLIFFYTAYFVMMGWYLFRLKPILGLSILIIFIPSMVSKIATMHLFQTLEERSAPIRRRYEYYEKCMIDKEFYKETRLLGVYSYFSKLYMDAMKKLNQYTLTTTIKKDIIDFLLKILTALGYVLIIFMLFKAVMSKELSVGSFAAIIASLRSMFNFMNEAISERFTWAADNIAAVTNFICFVNEEEKNPEMIPNDMKFNIEFRDVSFTYPGTTKAALNHINITINKGETVAIVGENGSGKSTFCRLIAGLYNPTKGSVFYDDMDAKDIQYENISAVFQNFCKYKLTLRENVCVSKMNKTMMNTELTDFCKEIGIDANESNLDTILSSEFNGTDISGGQWQRIAIARGIYRDNNLIVLDEPTSAIDPMEETRLYKKFAELCKNKTGIIVTHRLASVKIADRIIVLKNGKIIQDGNHNQLINEEGEYKKMFEEQKKWYVSY